MKQLPNLVSLLRLGMAPFVFRAIWYREYEWALAWLAAAAATDFLDGFLARRLGVTSRVGAYLDPLADKVLLSGTYFMLGYDRVIPLWLPAIVFGRDALMLAFIAYAYFVLGLRRFPPTLWGKLSTLVQIAAAFTILVSGLVFIEHERLIRQGMMLAAAAATLWSALDYARIGVGMLRAGKPENHPIDGASARG